MKNDDIITGVLIEETTTYTLIEVCQRYHISEALIQELAEHGFFPTRTTEIKNLQFTETMLRRMESAFRLHRDLDINMPGVVLAMELLDQIESLNRELKMLHR